MKTIMMRTILFGIALAMVGQSPAMAQEALPLQVSPTRQEIEADPGETVSFNVRFFNFGTAPVSGLIQVADFIVDNDDGSPRIIDNANEASPRFSGSQWIELPFDRMSIAAEDRVSVQARLTVPADARPGGRYVAIYFEPAGRLPEPGNTIREAGSAISPRIGALVFIKVKGPITEKTLISRLFAPSFLEYGPIPVETDIMNTGDYHVRPRGSITLKNMFGNSVDQEKLRENNIFPDRFRTYKNELGHKWMVGQYTLEVKAAYGDGGQIIERSINVWVFPWKVALAIVLAVIILILIIRYIQQNYVQKLEAEHQEVEKLKKELNEKE
jgi:uncharacterized repeat protein (TIGR01451 family)